MKTIVTSSYEEMSSLAVAMLQGCMLQDKRVNLAITAGRTPEKVYEQLTPWYKQFAKSLTNVHFYNFDELEPVGGGAPITLSALQAQFFGPAGVPKTQIEALTYENHSTCDARIAESGGLDMMLIGLGGDGHFCGNMPHAADLSAQTYKLFIKEEYPWYEGIRDLFAQGACPDYFVTMGLQSLMRVKHLVLIANGAGKAKAVRDMCTLPMSAAFPASGLRLHPNFTLLLDQEAASLL